MSDKTAKYVAGIAWLVGAVIVMLIFTGFVYVSESPEAQALPKLCEVGTVNEDGSVTITEESAGQYNYTVFATSDGIKVLGECE